MKLPVAIYCMMPCLHLSPVTGMTSRARIKDASTGVISFPDSFVYANASR